MRYISFSEYFDKYSEDFEEGFLLEVEQGNYVNSDEDFFEFMAYKFESSLAEKHPKNKHIKEKIRQQLQILRDKEVIEFSSPGKYFYKRNHS